ncbi:hypothetical protein OIU79_025559 [Salix purpurea]|uniref:Uncharacterized protein n=1 Tax=Salix purpurea TaxID=77065 RepID=A0A9Q0W4Y3_SALPP|nr:hypothetical protein OIU79_025559 [Salix purpurea]
MPPFIPENVPRPPSLFFNLFYSRSAIAHNLFDGMSIPTRHVALRNATLNGYAKLGLSNKWVLKGGKRAMIVDFS